MDFKQLNAFICVADTGSFTRAAQQCNIVQPALSKHIANLESELGIKLFVRSSQGAALSESGQLLYAHAQRLIKAKEAAVDAIQSSLSSPRGCIQVACIDSLSSYLGPGIIEWLSDRQPNITLSFLSGSGNVLYKALQDASIDLAVLFKDICIYDDDGTLVHKEELFTGTTLDCIELFEEALCFCSHQDVETAEEAAKGSLALETALNLPLLMCQPEHAISQCIAWLSTIVEQAPNIIARSNSIDVIKTLVGRNRGHALLPSSMVAVDKGNNRNNYIKQRTIEGYHIKRTIVLCSSSQADMSVSAHIAREAIEQYVKTIEGLK